MAGPRDVSNGQEGDDETRGGGKTKGEIWDSEKRARQHGAMGHEQGRQSEFGSGRPLLGIQ